MYSDIIPPKKRYTHVRTEEYNSVKFSSPHPIYGRPSGTKKPIVLFLAALVFIFLLEYHNFAHATRIVITSRPTRFDIKQHIPLVLQGRENDSLTYSLVYVPEEGVTRNPFVSSASSSPERAASTKIAPAVASITITASTTGDVKKITLINTTGDTISLRNETRFDVQGITYTLNGALAVAPTDKKIIDSVKTKATSSVYRVIGFKGYSTYDSVYAVPEITQTNTEHVSATSTGVSLSQATSTVPPRELLSLMPSETLALEKSTIYDKIIGQSALVVFDQSTLRNFLRDHSTQVGDFYTTLKPFGESITYTIAILDYTLDISSETGKPVSLSALSIEIIPKVDTTAIAMQFAGFSKETMDTIEKKVKTYIDLKTIYKPFWSTSVSKIEKIDVDIQQ